MGGALALALQRGPGGTWSTPTQDVGSRNAFGPINNYSMFVNSQEN